MARIKHFPAYITALLVCSAFCAWGYGQDRFPPDIPAAQNNQKQAPKASAAGPAPTEPAPAQAQVSPGPPPSLLDHPSQPAKVNLVSGKLTVQADNSSLADILHQISKSSGMKIEGLRGTGDQRIFGIYGPGTPRDVLSDLLDGAGYNVLMLGQTPSGVPRELSLSVRPTGGGVPTAQQQPSDSDQNNDSGDDSGPTEYPDDQQNVTSPPGPPEIRRTPQQMLQELQRIREQQQQQQQQSEPPQ